MGGKVSGELTVWEVCSLAYTMAAEQADRLDDLIRLAAMISGQEPQGMTRREELDDWLESPEEV